MVKRYNKSRLNSKGINMEDNNLYKELMSKFLEFSKKGDKKAKEIIDTAQKLSGTELDPKFKEEVDSQCYVELMGFYKSLAFEGKVPLSMKVLDAASYLIRVGNVSDDAAYAGAVI